MRNRTTSGQQPGPGSFKERYGGWALVAGASEGIGAAFARGLARRGMNLVLVARRKAVLAELAKEIGSSFAVEVRCLDGDLAKKAFIASLPVSTSDLDVGLLVYNAAHAPVGEFAAAELEALELAVDVNVRGPLAVLRAFLPAMLARGRGALVLMSSLAGNQGSPRIATYAATKAFARVLAEGLWSELKERGIDVIACCAGAVRTPGYARTAGKDAPGTLGPDEVVERTLRAIGRGPVVIPGLVNRAASWFMGRLLGRRAAIGIMAGSTGSLGKSEAERAHP